MSLQNIEDRVPTLPGRYLITHEDNSTEYVTVTRADEPTIAGTSFNRALFSNLQGDIYTGVQYNTPAYVGTAMTLDLPLTSYETGKIVNIISPATFSTNPTLNINGIGAKTVNALLTLNEKYTLIYNGNSFDVLSNVSTNKYYPMTKSDNIYDTIQANLIPQTGWTLTGTNEYTAENGVKISASSVNGSYVPTRAVDNSTTTYWEANERTAYYYIEFPEPIKILKMNTYIGASSSSGTISWSIQGSEDNTNWATLYSSTQRQTALTEVQLSIGSEYKYYRIYIYTSRSSSLPTIREIQTSAYRPYLFTVDYPLVSTSDNFQLNVKPNENGLTIGKNYLLVSGLGTKKEIDGEITQNELTTLAYNGTKFIKAIDVFKQNISFKQGTVSNGATIPQTAGFKYYLYFVSINNVSSNDILEIQCSVDQATRVVTCRSKIGSTSYENGTANYLEIAWN